MSKIPTSEFFSSISLQAPCKMAQWSLTSPLIALLRYETEALPVEVVVSSDSDATPSASSRTLSITPSTSSPRSFDSESTETDLTAEGLRRRMYERQLSKEIIDTYSRTPRKHTFHSILGDLFPELHISSDIIDLILDFEQNESISEIFKLFNSIKTTAICNIHVIPYILGWIQMIIIGYLSSEYWRTLETDHHFSLLRLCGAVLLMSASLQILGCYLCGMVNLRGEYHNKLINLKSLFLLHGMHHHPESQQHLKQFTLHCVEAFEDDASSAVEGWELWIGLLKWCGALRIQNIHNARHPQCTPFYVISFYLLKPGTFRCDVKAHLFCSVLLVTPHGLQSVIPCIQSVDSMHEI